MIVDDQDESETAITEGKLPKELTEEIIKPIAPKKNHENYISPGH